MFGKKIPKNSSCVGIDIGTNSIKAIELSRSGENCEIRKIAIKELPPEKTKGTLLETLKSIKQDMNLSAKDVYIALSGPAVTMRFINMPEMSQSDLKNSLRYEADKYIPYTIDEVVVDSHILEKAGQSKQMRVLLVAAKKDIINSRINLFKELGLAVKLIDVDAFSMFNNFEYVNKGLEKDKNIALLNMGHSFTNLLIFRDASPYFTRDIQIGAKDMIPPENVLSNLVNEIRLSFGYYENQYGSSIEKIFISGGLSCSPDTIKFLGENFDAKPETWDPFRNFSPDSTIASKVSDKDKPLFAVACGLALRNTD